MDIPFHRPYITDEEISEVVDSLKSGWITMGPKTIMFEDEFRKFIGAGHAVSVNSCTAALHLSLKAIGLKAGEEVIVPTMTFTATAEVVCYFGARPVIVDVEKESHNIDINEIEKILSPKTRAIIPVHFAGQPCDMDGIKKITNKNKLIVIEDAAHALPSRYKEKKIGTIGDITCFSFYASKTLTTGEGGMATTENGEWADKIRMLRLHGISRDAWKRYSREGSWYYEVLEAGFKYNMTDIQAGLGIAQLRKADWMCEKRKVIAGKYNDAFKDMEGLIIPFIKPERETSWHLYVIKLDTKFLRIDRDTFIEELKKMGVNTSVHFIPLHRHPFYRKTFSLKNVSYPNAEWIYKRSISLPIFPGMTDDEVAFVIERVVKILKKVKR